MWNVKNKTNESLFRTETQRHRNQTHGYQKGEGQRREGQMRSVGITDPHHCTSDWGVTGISCVAQGVVFSIL